VQVASVQKTADQAAAAGGRVLAPLTPLPGMGAIAVLMDPTGAAFGVWEMARSRARRASRQEGRKKATKKPAKKAAKKAKRR